MPPPPDSLILSNDYVEIVVNAGDENTGRFAVNTTGGDPTRREDDYKPLIYSSPLSGPWASYTTVRIDGTDYVFGGPTGMRAGRAGRYGEMVEAPRDVGGMVRTVWRMGDIYVTQELSIADSITTGFPDTAKISYRVENRGQRPHEVGLRIMLDTLLGENDGAPFRLGDEAITGDRVVEGPDIPQFFQAFDSLADPRVMSQGTLWGDDATAPDAVYFSNWGALADGVWEFDFRPGREFLRAGEFELDSALALYWYPKILQPRESRTYTTYYGLGGITIVAGQLSLGLTSPARVSGGYDEPVPFPVVAYIQNTGEGTARDVEATIQLPPGLVLAPGESATRRVGHLGVNETAQVSWRIHVAPGSSGDFLYRVEVRSSTSEPNRAERRVHVIAPALLSATLSGPERLDVVDERWWPVPLVIEGEVTNTGGQTAHGVTARLVAPLGLTPAAGDSAFKAVGPVEPGETVRLRWHLVPTGISANLPVSLALESANARVAASPTHFVNVPHLDAKIAVTVSGGAVDAGTPVRVGDYVHVNIEAINLPDLQEVALVLTYNPEVLRVLGGSLGVDRGNLFLAGGDNGDDPIWGGVRQLPWHRPQVDAERGWVMIAGSMGDEGPRERANGTIATIRFRAVGAGESALALQPWPGWIFESVGQPLEVLAVNHEGNPIHLSQVHTVVRVVERR